MKSIGILGGSFDPIHFGHLRMAIEAKEKYELDHVRFIPCKSSVLDKNNVASVEHRTAMLNLAIKDQKKLVLDEREIKRDTASFTIETLTSLQQDFIKDHLFLIIGSDAYQQFEKWHEWQKILELCTLVVAHRPGFDVSKRLADNIEFLELTALDISSTKIRGLVNAKHSVKYLLPADVIEYIQKHHLYI